MKYFIQKDGTTEGPLTSEELRQRVSACSLKSTDEVRREDSEAWVPLGSLHEFRHSASSQPLLDNPMAMASLMMALTTVLLVLALPLLMMPIFLITGVLAIIFGHMAASRISNSQDFVGGYQAAKWGLRLGYALTLILPVTLSFLVPFCTTISKKGNITQAISNCRQVITTLRLYSSDHDGKYPDGVVPTVRTSNEAFHLMFVGGFADNEMIFGCPVSPFVPDGNIGTAPDFREAVKPGENHWAMTRGLTDGSEGYNPLVYENPSDATWPPKWNPDLAGKAKPGRTWSNGRIVIGMNDSSISLQKLKASSSESVELEAAPDGSSAFPNIIPGLSVLNIAK